MPIVHCPNCSSRIEVQAEYSGQKFPCWRCRAMFQLPVLQGNGGGQGQVSTAVGCLIAALISAVIMGSLLILFAR